VPPAAVDTDGDGAPDCLDQCPTDPAKTVPGVCGCGAPETVSSFYRDADADGFGNAAASMQACAAPAGYVLDNQDCNDGNAAVHPGAAEVCNGIDDNCDGSVEDSVDVDKDGVNDCGADLCLGTKSDSKYVLAVPMLLLGQNRWVVKKSNGTLAWATAPSSKPHGFNPTIVSTHGCSCRQILDRLRGGGMLLGQYFFGCTKGTLENWQAAGND
jgi:hypothetical protein